MRTQTAMYNILKKVLICFLILMLFFSCSKEESYFQEIESPYSDLFNLPYHYKIGIIRVFKDIALGTEYGTGFQVTQKWSSTMNIFVGGSPNDELLSELDLIKNEINELATDGFSIKIVNDSLNSNFYIFFGQPNDYTDLFPDQISNIKDNQYGLFHFNLNNNFEITSGHMYVNTDIINSELKKHILREELTQSLGLPNDLSNDKNSIFYNGLTSVNSYIWSDILIIRLLYHPNMAPGLDADRVDYTLRGILRMR